MTEVLASHRLPPSDGVRYGLLGLPLAFCALPLYVLMPHFYATEWGVPLAALGTLLLALRLFDAVLDPWIGRWCDHWARRGALHLWTIMAGAAVVLGLAFAALFNHMVDRAAALPWAGVSLALTYLAYSIVTVAHQSWGAALGGDAQGRSTIVAWREGLGLAGVVLASALPPLVGAGSLGGLMAGALALAMVALRFAPRPPIVGAVADAASGGAPADSSTVPSTSMSVAVPWRNPAFVRLMVVFAINGIASAIPATLVLFFIEDRLQVSAAQQGIYLGLYFLCAAASMPVWLRVVARLGLERAWGWGMGLSIVAFVGASAVGAGDVVLYGAVCAASGLALGSDLAIPAALLSQVAERDGRAPSHGLASPAAHGVYFGWWNFAAKLNLALAAGLTLPLLAALGYAPGQRDPASLQHLTLVYCLLPCALKACAATALYLFFIRPQGALRHAT